MWIVENWPIIVAFISGVIVCLLVAVRFSKEPTERKIEPISKEEQLKRDRELQEYINMMTYDGTEQQPIDANKR